MTDQPSSSSGPVPLFTRDKLTLTVTIILSTVAALSWVGTYYLMPLMSAGSMMMGVASIVTSFSLASISVFEVIWVIGMVAMMFPAMIPIMLVYNKISANAEGNPSLVRVVGTPLFLLGYLLTYAGLGLVAYSFVFIALDIASSISIFSALALVGPSLVLILAGVYQLTPLKSACLSHCVSPLSFFLLHSRKGLVGSVRMGISHGAYCVGCCWAYMLVMLAVAAMSLPFMAILAVVIIFEKAVIRGAVWYTRAIAGFFLALGLSSLLFPGILGLLSTVI